MIQSLDLGNTDLINIDGQTVKKLQLNGVTLWTPVIMSLLAQRHSNGTAVIDGVEYPSEQNKVVAVRITSGQTSTFVTYDNITKEVPANTTMDCIWGMYKGVDDGTANSGEINIVGGMVRLESCSYPTTVNSVGEEVKCLLSVLKWNNGGQFDSTEKMFYGQQNLSGIINVPEGITELGDSTFYEVGGLEKPVTINLPTSLLSIGDDCFLLSTFPFDENGYVVFPTIPANVKNMGNRSLAEGTYTSSTKTLIVRFLQPIGMEINLPDGGSDSNGLAYSKTSRNYIIYTDNETIKNYNWSADNVVATIYHLDGTAWE